MTRFMTIFAAVLALTACETEEEIQMWEDAFAEAEARGQAYEEDDTGSYDDVAELSCAERLALYERSEGATSGDIFNAAPVPAKGTLKCGKHNEFYTNGTDRKKSCTVTYTNTCFGSTSRITGGASGPQSLTTTQNGGSADIDIDVNPGETLTFRCNGTGGPDKSGKCTFKSSCVDAPADAPPKSVDDR